jgi:hypothetical protein
MSLRNGRGSKIQLLQTGFHLHGRTAEEKEKQTHITQLGGRRSFSYCENMYLAPQLSLITMRRHPKRIRTHLIVTNKMKMIPWLLPRRSQEASVMSRLANQLGVTQKPSETRGVASVVLVINTNSIWHFQFLPLLFSCSFLAWFVRTRGYTVCLSRTSSQPTTFLISAAIYTRPVVALLPLPYSITLVPYCETKANVLNCNVIKYRNNKTQEIF